MIYGRLVQIAEAFGRKQRDALTLMSDFCFEAGIGIKDREIADIFLGDLEYYTDSMHGHVSRAAMDYFVAAAKLGFFGNDSTREQRSEWQRDCAAALETLMQEQRDVA